LGLCDVSMRCVRRHGRSEALIHSSEVASYYLRQIIFLNLIQVRSLYYPTSYQKVLQAPTKDVGGDRQSKKESECKKPPRQGVGGS
jgi:hypothetical protein